MWNFTVVDRLGQNIRYAFRLLRKARSFTAITVFTLGLGIAVNTTIFSLVSAVLLRKPAVEKPDRLMMILGMNSAQGLQHEPLTANDVKAIQERGRVFQGVAAFTDLIDATMTGYAEPAHLQGMSVSANYFRVLGVPATLGRTFLPGEDQPGHEHVIILSHDLWEQRFSPDPHIIGKSVLIDGYPQTVIGIMPPRLRVAILPAQFWMPLVLQMGGPQPANDETRSLYALGRLARGASVEQAKAEAAVIASEVDRNRRTGDKGWSATVISLQQYLVDISNTRPALIILMGAVGFVLLIACANVANLLWARTAVRAREMAVRSALGGSRWRIGEQLLIECLMLGLLGGVLGLLLAYWGIHLLRSALTFNEVVRTIEPSVDFRVLLFTLAASLVTVLLFGLRPFFQMVRPCLQTALKEGTRGGSSQPLRTKTRNALVTGEVALAIFLLVGAGLMIDSLIAEMRDNLGFSPSHVVATQLALSKRQYDTAAKQAAFSQHLLQKVRTLPGTLSAGVSTSLPATASTGRVDFSLEKSSGAQAHHYKARLYTVSTGYLHAMDIPLLRGRDFGPSDREDAAPVVLVNQAFVERFSPNSEVFGQYIRIAAPPEAVQPPWREIVGVVGNVKDFIGQPLNEPQIYSNFLQNPQFNMNVVVRTRLEPTAVARSLRQAVWSIDKSQPVEQIAAMAQVLDEAAAGDRLLSELLGLFAFMALVLASVGIYGSISYSVAERTQEIGVRMALGAERGQVLGLVLTDTLFMTVVGLAIGLAIAGFLPGLLKGMFVGLIIPPNLFAVFSAVAWLIIIVSLLASYFPAIRALQVDPMIALRYE